MRSSRTTAWVSALLVAAVAVVLGTVAQEASAKKETKADASEDVALDIAKIYWEYNSSGPDLGVHVMLDGEDWKSIKIVNPDGAVIFKVEGREGYKELGMTELFFEGAEPNLNEFPLEDLLEMFPEGEYEFEGLTVDGEEIEGTAVFSHAIPDAPSDLGTMASGSTIKITWDPPGTAPPDEFEFPAATISIKGFQVIVGSFQVTLPASATQVTLPPEFYASLATGTHQFEVLAIEVNGNQTITEGSFTK